MGVFAQFAAEALGSATLGLLLFSLPLLLIAPRLGVNPLPASPSATGLFAISLALGVSTSFALEYIFSACAIALQMHPYPLNSVRAATSTLLSGAFLPFALMPWGLGRILEWLPFGAQASAPLRIYTGTGEPLRLIAMQAVWSALLWPLAIWLWRRYQERMVSYGG
jgi:ABC-type uncharacterized transport system permease subunit